MACIGGFIAGRKDIINYLRYNLRSQIYAKSLPMPIVEGCLKRLELIRKGDDLRARLWKVTRALQNGLRERGFDIGVAEACVTPVFLHGDVPEATNILVDLRENYKIFCSVVVYPVVPRGVIMFRLIPTAMHDWSMWNILSTHSRRSRKNLKPEHTRALPKSRIWQLTR